jgi:hypothetical protein
MSLVSRGAHLAATLTLRRLMSVIAFVSIFAVATNPSADSDTWWHLRSGMWMLAHRQIMTADAFSWTRAGQPWIDHSWLSEVGMAMLWKGFGFAGLNLAVAALVTLAFLFVYLQCEGGVYLRALVLQLAAFSVGLYWSARPQIASLALASAFAYILSLFRWRGRDRLWALPALMVLWVNLHAGFAVGLLLIALTLAGQVVSRAAGARGPGVLGWPGIARLAAAGLACVAVVPLNPFGARMLSYPFETVSIGALRALVEEWMSPNFHMLSAQPFVWLLIATLAALGLGRKRIDLTDFVLLSAFLYAALLAARNIPLFALIAPPVLTRHAAAAAGEVKRPGPQSPGTRLPPAASRPGQAVVNWLLLLVVVVVAGDKIAVPLRLSVNEAAIATLMPVRAAEYIRSTRPPGELFNSYNWGGYLAWTLYPAYRVYIDGRTDLYGEAFILRYLRLVAGQEDPAATLDGEGVRLVVIETGSALAGELRRTPRWRQAYADALASVFERR